MESKSSQLSISNSLSFSSKCQLLESPLDCLIPKLGGCHREYKKGKMAKGRKMTARGTRQKAGQEVVCVGEMNSPCLRSYFPL